MNLLSIFANLALDSAEYVSSFFSEGDADFLLLSMGHDATVGDVSIKAQELQGTINKAYQDGISFSSLEDAYKTIENLSDVYAAINGFATEIDDTHVASSAADLVEDVLSFALLERLWDRHPAGMAVLHLIGAVESEYTADTRPIDSLSPGTIHFKAPDLLRIDAASIENIFVSQDGLFKAKTSSDMSAIKRMNEHCILALHCIGRAVGIPLRLEYPVAFQYDTLPDGQTFEQNASKCIGVLGKGAKFAVVPGVQYADNEDPSFALKFVADGNSSVQFSPGVEAEISANSEILITNNDIQLLDGQEPNVVLKLRYTHTPNNGVVKLGLGESTGITADAVEFSCSLKLDAAEATMSATAFLCLNDAKFTIDNSLADTFVGRLVGNENSSNADVGLGFSTDKGFHFVGGNGLNLDLPTHMTIGPVDFRKMHLEFDAPNHSLQGSLSGDLAAHLGPLFVIIEKVGVSVSADFGTGSLGLVDLTEITFKPPAGAALVIDSGVVAGSGYLFFDTNAQEYGGAVELSFQSFGLAAVGLITTKMPDGSSGFSLMVIISAEFSAVQLGFGFTLTGVGGLLGINRQADVQALRSNMKSGGLNSIMFPENVVENAQRIVSDVGAAFPVAEGNHVFGPILRIGWGTPTLFELTMGVVLSFPSPFKVVLLGRFELALPSLEFDGEVPPVWIKVDFLGVIDPAGGVLSLDGVLYDSRLLGYSLEGQFAMQQTFGDDPKFLVSIGGFHPNFEPPPRVPELKRLSLTLGNGGNPRLRNELYKAVTSNTFQMGARVEAYAAKGGFEVFGTAGYDALVIFSPFGLDVSFYIRGHVAKKGGPKLLSLDIKLNLTGPDPWRAKGRASFEVLFVTVKVRFNLTFGDSGTPKLPETDVLTKLTNALEETRNWSVKLPERTREPVVMFRELPADTAESLLHPEASLTVRQKVVPLGFDIERYSGAIPTAGGERVRRFEIDSLDLNGTTYSASQPDLVTEEKEKFAPGAYLKLSDEEKLSRPSFESFTAGATLAGSQGYSISGSTESVDTTYEQSVVDTSTGFAFDFQGVLPPQSVQAAHAQIFSQVADDSGTDSSVYQPEKLGIRVDDPAYTVVAKDDAGRMANIPADTNFYEANKALEDSGQSTEDYHVVLTHEEKAA